MDTVFSCKNITKSYQGTPTVQAVSLQVTRGQMVSLLGASGVGKTTLFNVLAGVDCPDSGQVLLGGEDITGQPGRVSYMLQKDLLLPYKTVLDNCCLPLLLKKMPKKEARIKALELFGQFGLAGCEKKYPQQLSGGMRQRAALLRTHLAGGEVILLDEAFSSLDAITKAGLQSWYLKIMAQIGASTLFITHDIDEALLLSDKIYILAGQPGQITKAITPPPLGARDTDFAVSQHYMQLKREILEEIARDFET